MLLTGRVEIWNAEGGCVGAGAAASTDVVWDDGRSRLKEHTISRRRASRRGARLGVVAVTYHHLLLHRDTHTHPSILQHVLVDTFVSLPNQSSVVSELMGCAGEPGGGAAPRGLCGRAPGSMCPPINRSSLAPALL
jgi:hypothetical protein